MRLEQTSLIYRWLIKEQFHYFDKVGFIILAKEEIDENNVGGSLLYIWEHTLNSILLCLLTRSLLTDASAHIHVFQSQWKFTMTISDAAAPRGTSWVTEERVAYSHLGSPITCSYYFLSLWKLVKWVFDLPRCLSFSIKAKYRDLTIKKNHWKYPPQSSTIKLISPFHPGLIVCFPNRLLGKMQCSVQINNEFFFLV